MRAPEPLHWPRYGGLCLERDFGELPSDGGLAIAVLAHHLDELGYLLARLAKGAPFGQQRLLCSRA